MNHDAGIPVFIGVLGVALVGRLIADRLDRRRIRENLSERGCSTIEIHWSPFGPGWFGENGDRIYEVIYLNKSGRRIVANCKTCMLSGVYWRDHAESKEHSECKAEPEPVECLACGKPMGGSSECPECGWSYKAK